MAKRIEFTPGIEAMRGSFSPKQTLLYALNNNPAFEAPVGRQYARNYQANFVGAKRAATGLKYFYMKTKSATLVTAASKQRMAISGGVGAIYAAILEAPTMRARLEYAWKNYFHSPKTFRAFMDTYLRDMLTRKASAVQIGRDSEGTIIVVGNPWNASSTASYIPAISEDVLVKFWLQLAAIDGGAAPLYFTVDGRKGLGFENQTFTAMIDVTRMNVLSLSGGVTENLRVGGVDGPYVKLGTSYVEIEDTIVADGKYYSTEVAPV